MAPVAEYTAAMPGRPLARMLASWPVSRYRESWKWDRAWKEADTGTPENLEAIRLNTVASLTPATIDISGEPVTVLRGHGHTQPAPPATGFPYHAIPSPAHNQASPVPSLRCGMPIGLRTLAPEGPAGCTSGMPGLSKQAVQRSKRAPRAHLLL
jgi:hypothetical protein